MASRTLKFTLFFILKIQLYNPPNFGFYLPKCGLFAQKLMDVLHFLIFKGTSNIDNNRAAPGLDEIFGAPWQYPDPRLLLRIACSRYFSTAVIGLVAVEAFMHKVCCFWLFFRLEI